MINLFNVKGGVGLNFLNMFCSDILRKLAFAFKNIWKLCTCSNLCGNTGIQVFYEFILFYFFLCIMFFLSLLCQLGPWVCWINKLIKSAHQRTYHLYLFCLTFCLPPQNLLIFWASLVDKDSSSSSACFCCSTAAETSPRFRRSLWEI